MDLQVSLSHPGTVIPASLRVSTRNELVSLHERLGATTIYVTHDQVEAMTMGSRICIVNDGQLVQIGPPMEVYRRPANTFVAAFLGSPPMNLLPANLVKSPAGRSSLRIGPQVIEAPAEWDHLPSGHSKEVILGIRPEDIFLSSPSHHAGTIAELDLEVGGIEALGADTVLIFKVAGLDQTLFVKADRFAEARRGDRMRVKADMAAARLFDPLTKQVINPARDTSELKVED